MILAVMMVALCGLRSYVALLLRAVLQEGVDQLWPDQVRGVQLLEDERNLLVVQIVLHPPEHGQAGHEDGVAVVPLRWVLAKLHQSVSAAQAEDVEAHLRVRAQSARGGGRTKKMTIWQL